MALFGPASSSPRFPQAPQTSYQQQQASPQPSFGQASFPAAPQHLPNMQGFGVPAPQQAAAANNPFLAEAGLLGGQQTGLGGQLAGLNLNQGQQAPLWQ